MASTMQKAISNDIHYPAKLLTLQQACKLREQYRQAGMRVVMANGIFDVLHGGHISYLEDARSQGDVLFVGVNSDQSTKILKGPGKPVFPLSERIELLNAVRFVDHLVVFEEKTCETLLRSLKPDVHAKGTDYTVETVPEREIALELGIETYIAGPPKENASRNVIATIIEKYSAPSSLQ